MSVFPVNISHQLFPVHGTKFVAKRTATNYMTHSGLSLDYPLLMTQACQLERFSVDSQLSQFLSYNNRWSLHTWQVIFSSPSSTSPQSQMPYNRFSRYQFISQLQCSQYNNSLTLLGTARMFSIDAFTISLSSHNYSSKYV